MANYMTFPTAVEALLLGRKIRRKDWVSYVEIKNGRLVQTNGKRKPQLFVLHAETAQAVDWEVAE